MKYIFDCNVLLSFPPSIFCFSFLFLFEFLLFFNLYYSLFFYILFLSLSSYFLPTLYSSLLFSSLLSFLLFPSPFSSFLSALKLYSSHSSIFYLQGKTTQIPQFLHEAGWSKIGKWSEWGAFTRLILIARRFYLNISD